MFRNELAMSLVRVNDIRFKPIQTLKFYFSDLKNPEIQQKLISEALEMLDTCSFQMGAILYSFDLCYTDTGTGIGYADTHFPKKH